MQFQNFAHVLPVLCFLLLFLPLPSTPSPFVRYCDGIFQLANRTDESEQTCKWFAPHIIEEHIPCNTSSGEDGLTCGGECIGLGDWCIKGTDTPTSCGYHLQDPAICRNQTFWEKQKCPETSKGRCTGWWPGQCEGEDGCRDKSNYNNTVNKDQCLTRDTVINVTKDFITCEDKYNFRLLVCGKQCDRVLDGCKDDSDEKDCVAVVSKMTLVVLVVMLITVTIIASEITLWALEVKSSHEDPESTEIINLIKQSGATNKEKIYKMVCYGSQGSLKDNEVLVEIASNLEKLFDVILNRKNWVFGELQLDTCATFAAPIWTTGTDVGFKEHKMETLKALYNNFRKMIPGCQAFTVRKCDCPRCMCFRFFLYAVPNKSPEKPRQHFEKLPHYVFDLIYNKLEVEFLKENVSLTEDIDISIKYALGNRESSQFYGNVTPYLHIPTLFKTILHLNGGWTEKIANFIDNIRYIKYITYFIGIIIAIAGFYVDFIKDVLIADHVSFLYTTFWDFESLIVFILWATIFVSQTVIGIMIVISGPTKLFKYRVESVWKRYLIRGLFLLMSPLSPTLLLYMNARLGWKISQIEKKLNKELEEFHPPKVYHTVLENLKQYHKREHLVKRKRKMESVIGTSYKIGVIYENTPQILVQVLIVLLSLTTVTLPSLTGIEAVFDTHNDNDNIGSFFFFFSIIWSLISIITSLVSTFLYRKEYSVGDLGKILTFFQIFISASLRLICIILYTAPFLGLFDLLLHYQIGLKISYSQEVLAEMDENVRPSLDLSYYLLMSRGQALVVFFFFPLAHASIVLIYKSRYVDEFTFEKVISIRMSTKDSDSTPAHSTNWLYILSVYKRCLHAFSSLLGPTLWRDWDFPIKSNRQDYQRLWRKAKQEYLHMSIIFFLENLFLLVPLLHTCNKVVHCHAELQFPLHEEQLVSTYCYWFFATPIILLILSCLHYYLFILYNRHGHPWSILLTEKIKEEESMKNEEISLTIKDT